MANLPVPVPRTYTVGETETGAYFNATRDALNFLINIPIATVYQTVVQTLTTSSNVYMVTFDSTAVDTYGGHSNSTNNSEYVAQVAGWYLVTGGVCFQQSGSGTNRKAQVYHNGAVVPYAPTQLPPVSATYATSIPVPPAFVYMNVGDYVQIGASADVTGINTLASNGNESSMTIIWMHA